VSGHHTYPGLEIINMSKRSAVASGDHLPPVSCAQTRITPNSVTAHVAHPDAAPPENQLTAMA